MLRSKKNEVVSILVIAALVFLAFAGRYFRFLQFGLYEDDLTIIPKAMQMSFGDLFAFIWNYIIHLYGHARPLSDSMIFLFSNLGWRLGGFSGPYIIGFMVVAANSVLFYLMLRKVQPGFFAISGALAYIFFSADTTQAFLTHSLGLQPSLTLLLLGFHAYICGKKWLAYSLVFIILFSYETPFLVFMGAPFLILPLNTKSLATIIRHGFILALMLVVVIVLRSAIGEGRVADLSPIEMIKIPIIHMLQGPLVSLGTYGYRLLQTFQSFSLEILLVIVCVFPIIYLLLIYGQEQNQNNSQRISDPEKPFWKFMLDRIDAQKNMLVAGFVMLVCAYPLTYTVRAYAISGRDTRVHAAAVIGASFLVACCCTVAWGAARRYGKTRLLIILLSGYFAGMCGYGFVIQKDYVNAWIYQQEFWNQIIQLAPDIQDSTVILVEPSGLKNPRQIDANTWNLPRIYDQLFQFPSSWKNPPRVYRLTDNWEDNLVSEDRRFQLNVLTTVAPPSLYGEFTPLDVIFIHSSGDKLTRRTEPLPVGDSQYELKPVGEPILDQFQRKFLSRFMLP